MRFYTQQHPHYCGIDLHARTMYLCILNQAGAIVLHRNMKADPDSLSDGDWSLSRSDRRRCRMYLHLVLACRSLCSREDHIRAWPCSLYEGDPRRQSEKRQDRCPEDRRAAARRNDSRSLRLSRTDAFDARPVAAANAHDASARRITGSCPEHEPLVQPSGYRKEDLL